MRSTFYIHSSPFRLHDTVIPPKSPKMSMEKDLGTKDLEVASDHCNHLHGWEHISKKLLTLGVESRGKCFTYLTAFFNITFFSGILPVSLDERINKPYSKTFFIWFSMNVNILSYEGFLPSSFFY